MNKAFSDMFLGTDTPYLKNTEKTFDLNKQLFSQRKPIDSLAMTDKPTLSLNAIFELPQPASYTLDHNRDKEAKITTINFQDI